MATEIPGKVRSGVAAADLSTKQFFAVIETNAGKIDLNTTAGAPVHGILQDKPTLGTTGAVMVDGQTKWVAGAAIPFLAGGTPVMSDNAGRCVAATSTNQIIGWLAPQSVAPTGAGQLASVELVRGGAKP